MVLAVVYDVSVTHDWFDILSLLAGFGGLAAALVALRQAAKAQRTANEAVTDERRRQFELEILRDLANALDAGLASMVFVDPKYLHGYAIRLDLIYPRLQFWDKIAALDNYLEVSAAVGLPELLDAEKERATLIEDVRNLQAASESLLSIRTTEETWELQDQQGLIDWESRTMQIGRRQQEELTQRTMAMIAKWVPNPPAFTDVHGWNQVVTHLKELLAEQDAKSVETQEQVGRLRAEAEVELRRLLVWDVDQAIKSRVEARQFERHRWWHRKRKQLDQ